MASFNRVIMMGNLTRDPERKQLNTGTSVCRLGIASNRQFKNKQTGTMSQEVCFVDVEVWGAQAESCAQYLQKGKPVLIEGRLKLDSWEDNGVRRSKHYIVADRVTFLGSASAQQDEAGEDGESAPSYDQPAEGGSSVEAKKKREVKAKETVKPAATQSFTSTIGEIDFKSEQPFDDELPFQG